MKVMTMWVDQESKDWALKQFREALMQKRTRVIGELSIEIQSLKTAELERNNALALQKQTTDLPKTA